jgi:hypothetical protein
MHIRFGLLRSCKGIYELHRNFPNANACYCGCLYSYMTRTITHLRRTQATTQQIFWLPNFETICNTGFFCLGLEERVLAQLKLCMGVVVKSSIVVSAEVSDTPFWRPNRHKDFLVVAFNWHQHHPTFLQLLFFCPVFIMSIQNVSTIQCNVLLFSNIDAQFSSKVSVKLFLKHNHCKWTSFVQMNMFCKCIMTTCPLINDDWDCEAWVRL